VLCSKTTVADGCRRLPTAAAVNRGHRARGGYFQYPTLASRRIFLGRASPAGERQLLPMALARLLVLAGDCLRAPAREAEYRRGRDGAGAPWRTLRQPVALGYLGAGDHRLAILAGDPRPNTAPAAVPRPARSGTCARWPCLPTGCLWPRARSCRVRPLVNSLPVPLARSLETGGGVSGRPGPSGEFTLALAIRRRPCPAIRKGGAAGAIPQAMADSRSGEKCAPAARDFLREPDL
jgi:hypothetical protein